MVIYNCKYFKDSEFKACVPSCSLADMNFNFIALLDKIRETAGIPIVLNSAYRSVAYEKSCGRAGTSSHCKGIAVDIRCSSSVNRARIIDSIYKVCSYPRIGVASTYIHFDIDMSKPRCFWLY